MSRLHELASRLHEARVAVAGDFIADRYVFGRPVRLSREAPVVVMRYEGEKTVPGSAGNTAYNLATVGARTHAVGVLGDDDAGRRVRALLAERGVEVSGLSLAPCETALKTRILAGDRHTVKQQVVRIDRDEGFAPGAAAREAVAGAIRSLRGKVNVLVVSDYGYGTVDDRGRDEVLRLGDSLEFLVDSHDRLHEFPGAWIVTPNEGEAERASGVRIASSGDALRAGRSLREKFRSRNVLLTRGNQGMILFTPEGEVEIPISGTDEITDVSGAGDTVVAFMAAARSVGASPEEAARLANAAAGVVVMKRGTATCSPEELARALDRAGE
ncbi:MAG: PfkB family carbohydrate kinase [Planctomycetes bacterium]|nr:PfkB family carbohydrate kinase [Planctomycetota bacterium]